MASKEQNQQKTETIGGKEFSGNAIEIMKAAPDGCGQCDLYGMVAFENPLDFQRNKYPCSCLRGKYFANLPPSI